MSSCFRTCSVLSALIAIAIGVGPVQQGGPTTAMAEDTAAASSNPYIPREGMSLDDLQAYVERMLDAPQSIRNRPGHAEGMAVAAERMLASEPSKFQRRLALTTLLDSLHQQADLEDNAEADKRLAELAAKHASDDDKSVAKLASLYALEQEVLASEKLSQEQLGQLLDKVNAALKDRELGAKHLRLASATVAAINRIEDDDAATKRLGELGKLFAASDDAELAKYGRKLAGSSAPKGDQADWIGKPAEVAGATADGLEFDIAEYKGKVVLVDFWATWCGPCKAALPGLKKTHSDLKAKGFEVVGISLDRDLEALGAFLEDDPLPWVNLIGEKDGDAMKFPLAEKYGIRAIPTTFLVDKQGKIVAKNLHGDALRKEIEKLLAAE